MTYRIVVLGICLLHFGMLAMFHEPGYNSPDAHGYFLQAKLLAESGRSQLEDDSPVQMIGVHWLETEDGELYSRYPTGFPLIIAFLYKLWGPEAATWINLVLCSLSLPLLYYTTKSLLNPVLGVLAIALLAANPVFNQYALNADSHISTLFFLLAGLAALTRWHASGSWQWALAAGFLLGYIPMIRYPEALYGVGIAAFLLIAVLQNKERAHSAIIALLGAGFPVLYILVRNTIAFDAPWRTAYALTNEQSGFSMDYFLSSYGGYLDGLMANGLGPAFVLGILGTFGMLLKKDMRPWGGLILFICLPITLLYMAYYFGNGSEMTMRFVLPTFPLYIIGACYLIKEISANWKLQPAWIGLVLFLLTSITAIPESLAKLARGSTGIRASVFSIHQLQQYVPQGSVVFMGQQQSQLADFLGHWKIADSQLLSPDRRPFDIGGPAVGEEQSSRPSPRQLGRRDEIVQRYRDLSPEEKMDLVLEDAMDWAAPDTDVYIVSDASTMPNLQRLLHPDYEWQLVAEIDFEKGIQHDWRDKLMRSATRNTGRGGPGGFRRSAFTAMAARATGEPPRDWGQKDDILPAPDGRSPFERQDASPFQNLMRDIPEFPQPPAMANRVRPPLTIQDTGKLSVCKLALR